NLVEREGHRAEHELYLSDNHIEQRGCAAFVRHMCELNVGDAREQSAAEMIDAADVCRRICDRIRFRPGEPDHCLTLFAGKEGWATSTSAPAPSIARGVNDCSGSNGSLFTAAVMACDVDT